MVYVDDVKNLIQIILCIVLFGSSAFCRKMSVDRIHPYQLQIVAGIVYALVVPIWLYLLHASCVSSGYDRAGVIWGIGCILANVIGVIIFGGLLRSSSDPGMLATLIAMNPLVTLGLTVAFLGEELTLKKVLSVFLMLCGFVMFNL